VEGLEESQKGGEGGRICLKGYALTIGGRKYRGETGLGSTGQAPLSSAGSTGLAGLGGEDSPACLAVSRYTCLLGLTTTHTIINNILHCMPGLKIWNASNISVPKKGYILYLKNKQTQ